MHVFLKIFFLLCDTQDLTGVSSGYNNVFFTRVRVTRVKKYAVVLDDNRQPTAPVVRRVVVAEAGVSMRASPTSGLPV